MITSFIDHLIERHSQGLPGREFQLKKAALSRRHLFEAPPTARQSAVLILLFPKANEWQIVLTERVGSANDPHSHQISFPGGSLDASDVSLEACALRETYEEVGIPPQTINIIGKMTDLYIPVSNFHVHPFIGWTAAQPHYQPQATEVKEIIEAPLSILMNPDNQKSVDMTLRGMHLPNVPYFDVYGRVVWGATAMMLSEFLEMV